MNTRTLLTAGSFIALAALAVCSIGLSQDAGKEQLPPITAPKSPDPSASASLPRDIAKASLPEKQAYLSCQRGVDWLRRVNRPDGRFVFGYLPSLRVPMEGDNYLHQIEAARALARAGRIFRDDKAQAIARQALLTLLLDTSVSPKSEGIRHTSAPSALVNRLSAAGLLALAIHELPAAEKDLVAQAAQLCNFVHSQQRSDGSLIVTDADAATLKVEAQIAMLHAGRALAALMRYDAGPAAAAKIQAVRKARDFYSKTWSQNKHFAVIHWHTAAYAEAFRMTKEPAFAECVFAMNDWLCDQQYQNLEARHPLWLGGFKAWTDGNDRTQPPDVDSAACLESLVDACRTARQAGDVRRWQRYRQAADRCAQFLATLQYTDAGTQHFAEWYRPVLVGGFHRSHQEGDLRLDFTAGAVAALTSYVSWVAEQPAE